MQNTMILQGLESPISEIELHLPRVDNVHMLYLRVSSGSTLGGFALWDIELSLLDNIEDLDGRRIHIMPDGETYEDDTLGTDIIGAMTDANYWSTYPHGETDYVYGDILVDFKRIEGKTYQVHVEMTLADPDEDPDELSPDEFNMTGSADFVVTIDEINPME